MDVVYVLGTGSKWNDTEIRFSLRSVEKNLKGFRNVVIVGELPGFLKNVIHIPAPDIFEPGLNADGNIITKVLAACADERVSDDFLFINDDHLVIRPIDIADVPPLHKGDLTARPPDYWKFNYWRGRLKRTMEVLAEKGYSTLHFDCHTPIIFNKREFPSVIGQFNFSDGIGYTMKSLYGNVMYPDGPFLTDQKRTVFKHYTIAELKERLARPVFVAFNDDGLNRSFKWWLIDNFRSKSRWEKDLPDDKIFDLFFWLLSDKPWNNGVEIFKSYWNHKNLIRMFEMGETPVLRKKLEFKLMQTIKEL